MLIKWSVLAAAGARIGVSWWQLYDNLYPLTLEEEKGAELLFLKNYTTTNDIAYFDFDDQSVDYR